MLPDDGHGVGLEQYLAVDPGGPDGGLAFGPDQPVDERLVQFRLHVGMPFGVHHDDAVGVEQARVAVHVARGTRLAEEVIGENTVLGCRLGKSGKVEVQKQKRKICDVFKKYR